jgi:RNA polymerase sigma-70 factor (ECF subfamily)
MVESAPLAEATLPAPTPATASASIPVFVATHADFVWRSLRRLGVPASMADDATQQVFLIATSKLEGLRPGTDAGRAPKDNPGPGPERAFLFRTLSNVAAHVRRSLGRRRELAWAAVEEPADPCPAPDELLAKRQARELLDDVLDAMPDELRAVFVLSELEELTAPQVAELTGLPVGTVASRLRRGREEFQKAARRLRARLAPSPRTP